MRKRNKIEEFLQSLEGQEFAEGSPEIYFKVRNFVGGNLRLKCVLHEDVEDEPENYFRFDFFFEDRESGSEIIIYVEGEKTDEGTDKVKECTLALYHISRKKKTA